MADQNVVRLKELYQEAPSTMAVKEAAIAAILTQYGEMALCINC